MICVTYDVTCDEPDCEAYFTFESFGRVSDMSGLVRQLRGRGWRYQGTAEDSQTRCPLHLKKVPGA